MLSYIETFNPHKSSKIDETGKNDRSHRLIHTVPDGEFDQVGRELASEEIGESVFASLQEKYKTQLENFMKAAFHKGDTGYTGAL